MGQTFKTHNFLQSNDHASMKFLGDWLQPETTSVDTMMISLSQHRGWAFHRHGSHEFMIHWWVLASSESICETWDVSNYFTSIRFQMFQVQGYVKQGAYQSYILEATRLMLAMVCQAMSSDDFDLQAGSSCINCSGTIRATETEICFFGWKTYWNRENPWYQSIKIHWGYPIYLVTFDI